MKSISEHCRDYLDLQISTHQLSRLTRPRLDGLDMVLIVITQNLISRRFAGEKSIREVFLRLDTGALAVFPVIATAAAMSWQNKASTKLPTIPVDGKSPAEMRNQEEWLEKVAEDARSAAIDLTRDVSRKFILTDVAFPFDVDHRNPQGREGHAKADRVQPRLLREVFKPAGVPDVTFVEPDDFTKLRMTLVQPGIGIVIEGPSGVGKTTILKWALSQADGPAERYSARIPAHLQKISSIPSGHQQGIVAVDDFHRLPAALQSDLVDYMKVLADDDETQSKLVIAGIPGTAESLIDISFDVGSRIRVFQPGRVDDRLIAELIGKGESALNISFDNTDEIVRVSSGSLITAQALCWTLCFMAKVEEQVREHRVIRTDLREARRRVAKDLQRTYQKFVDLFICLDEHSEVACIDLLLELGKAKNGILPLDEFLSRYPSHRLVVDRLFIDGSLDPLTSEDHLRFHIFYDRRARRLIADDPQLIFFLKQLKRDDLSMIAGKRPPVLRDQVFVCYSHNDARWLDRLLIHLSPLERRGILDVWSDRRIEPGDVWEIEILTALDRARFAVLLISADFMASSFIQDVELPRLLAAAEHGGCRVLPVLVGASSFRDTPSLSCFQHVNPGGVTLKSMSEEDADQVLANLTSSVLKRLTP
jgi:hypothetical protein